MNNNWMSWKITFSFVCVCVLWSREICWVTCATYYIQHPLFDTIWFIVVLVGSACVWCALWKRARAHSLSRNCAVKIIHPLGTNPIPGVTLNNVQLINMYRFHFKLLPQHTALMLSYGVIVTICFHYTLNMCSVVSITYLSSWIHQVLALARGFCHHLQLVFNVSTSHLLNSFARSPCLCRKC